MRKKVPAARLIELAMPVPKMAPFEPRDKTGAIIPCPVPWKEEPAYPRATLFANADEGIALQS